MLIVKMYLKIYIFMHIVQLLRCSHLIFLLNMLNLARFLNRLNIELCYTWRSLRHVFHNWFEACWCACIHVLVRVHTHARTHACTHMPDTHTHARMHTRTHARTHTHRDDFSAAMHKNYVILYLCIDGWGCSQVSVNGGIMAPPFRLHKYIE